MRVRRPHVQASDVNGFHGYGALLLGRTYVSAYVQNHDVLGIIPENWNSDSEEKENQTPTPISRCMIMFFHKQYIILVFKRGVKL